MDPYTIALIFRVGLPLAERLGLFQSAIAAALADLQNDLRSLVQAPLNEGLRRLSYAEAASNQADRLALLREARAKFDDAAARDLDPIPRGWAILLAAGTWTLLGSTDLAAKAGKEALIAADVALCTVDAEVMRWEPLARPFWSRDPAPALRAAWELAGMVVQFNLNLGFPLEAERRGDDVDLYYYLEPGGSNADYLEWITPEFVADQRSSSPSANQ